MAICPLNQKEYSDVYKCLEYPGLYICLGCPAWDNDHVDLLLADLLRLSTQEMKNKWGVLVVQDIRNAIREERDETVESCYRCSDSDWSPCSADRTSSPQSKP